MFYDKFLELCETASVSRTKACVDCGLSRTAWRKWSEGAIPNGSTINAFAEYFGVPVGYLLGTDKKTPVTNDEREYINDDPELTEFLQELATRPEMRMLFHVSKDATKEDVEKAVAIIEALRKAEGR